MRSPRLRPPSLVALLAALPLLAACDDQGAQCLDPGPPCAGCTRTEDGDGCASYLCPPGCLAEAQPDIVFPDATPDATYEGPPVRYVRIADIAGDEAAEIDAVLIARRDGTVFYASGVERFDNHFPGSPEPDPTRALGPADTLRDWTGPTPSCHGSDEGAVTLGGAAGKLIVTMEADIVPGDYLVVLEVGGCTDESGQQDAPGFVSVSVSAGGEIDGQWIHVVDGEGPVVAGIVPELSFD